MKSDPALRLMAMQIFNDAMGEMQASSGDRIFPMAMLPWWDLGETLTEVERCLKMGMRGINWNPDTHSPRSAVDRRPALDAAVGILRRQ